MSIVADDGFWSSIVIDCLLNTICRILSSSLIKESCIYNKSGFIIQDCKKLFLDQGIYRPVYMPHVVDFVCFISDIFWFRLLPLFLSRESFILNYLIYLVVAHTKSLGIKISFNPGCSPSKILAQVKNFKIGAGMQRSSKNSGLMIFKTIDILFFVACYNLVYRPLRNPKSLSDFGSHEPRIKCHLYDSKTVTVTKFVALIHIHFVHLQFFLYKEESQQLS